MVKDIVCGMMVDEKRTEHKLEYNGGTYYFCSPGCQEQFSKNPKHWLKKKGWWGKFLDRLVEANEKQFHGKPPSCH